MTGANDGFGADLFFCFFIKAACDWSICLAPSVRTSYTHSTVSTRTEGRESERTLDYIDSDYTLERCGKMSDRKVTLM